MKKLAVLLLALSLVFTMAFSASAAGEMTGTGSASQAVTINLADGEGGTETETVYYIDVAWANTTLTYTLTDAEEVIEWDPLNHVYKVSEGADANAGSWSDPMTLTVVNHSNIGIHAEITGMGDFNGMHLGASVDRADLAAADVGTSLNNPGEAPKTVFTITPTGVPTTNFTTNVTLTIS
jgi:hypothetical protein